MIEKISTFVRTVGRQIIDGKKIFVGDVQIDGLLLDGNASTGTSGQVLSTTTSGVEWITVGSSDVGELNDLTDVTIDTASSGQLLQFDGESWVNWTHNFLTTSATLSSLTDVGNLNPTEGQILVYNSGSGLWVADDMPSMDETDTLDSVTGRGSTTTNSISVGDITSTGLDAPTLEYNGKITISSTHQTSQGDPTYTFLAFNFGSADVVTVDEDGYVTGAGFKTSGTTGFLRSDGTVDTSTYLTSFTESQDLDDVTGLGATTTNSITVGGVSAPTHSSANAMDITADTNGNIQPGQEGPEKLISFNWDTTEVGYIDTDSKITFDGFKTPTGTSAGFLKADGSVDTTTYLSSVTEAQDLDDVTTIGSTTTNSINVGGVTTDYVQLDTGITPPEDESQGYIGWDSDWGAPSLFIADSQNIYLGQDSHWYVKNGNASTLAAGTVVMASGAVGASSKIEVDKMVADGTVSSKYIVGILKYGVATGDFGYAVTQGTIKGIDTSSWSEGDVLWCDPNTDGGLTNVEPSAPNLRLPIAFVVSSGTSGSIAVRITQGNILHELHDVDASSPSNNDLLKYDSTTSTWKNWALPTYDNYEKWTVSDGTNTTDVASRDTITFSGAGSVSVDNSDGTIVITGTDTNTTYTAGTGLTLSGTEFSVTANTYAPFSHNHDDRYYTETESDARYARGVTISYSSVDDDPEEDAWYKLFQITDSGSTPVICFLRGYAHSSVTFIVSEGYLGSNAHVQILDYLTSTNNNYKWIKGVRIISNGDVEVLLNGGPTVSLEMSIIGDAVYLSQPRLSSAAASDVRDSVTSLTNGMIRAKGDITGANLNISNWDTAYGWGNHAGLYASATHNHDDRYYTETEVNTLLSGKSDTDHVHDPATTESDGFMSSVDKEKLDGIEDSANNYSLPIAGTSLGGIKSGTDISVDENGNVSVLDDSHTHDLRYLQLTGGTLTGDLVTTTISDSVYKNAGSSNWITKKYVRSVGLSGGSIGDAWVRLVRVAIDASYRKVNIKLTMNGYDDVSSGTEVIDGLYENGNTAQENHSFQWYSTDNNANLFKQVRSIRSTSSGLNNVYDIWVQMAGDWRDDFTVVAEYWVYGGTVTFITDAGTATEPTAGSDDKNLTNRTWRTQNNYMYLGANRILTTADEGANNGLDADTLDGNHASAFASSSHNHDDRYYTETEVNTLLSGKADTDHTHEISDVTGLQDELDRKLESESDTLDSVTDRGATTTNDVTVGGLTANGDTITFLNESAGNKNINIRKRFDASSFINWIRSSNTDAYMGVDESENFLIGYASSGLSRSLIFTSNNSEVIRFDRSGNVGIGTTSPSEKLHVVGNAVVASTTGTGNLVIGSSTSVNAAANRGNVEINGATNSILTLTVGGVEKAYFYTNGTDAILNNLANGALRFYANAGEKMRIQPSGNVGIGTTSPDFTLDVEKDVDTWVSRIYNTGSDANAQTLLVRSDATAAHDALVLGVYADGGYKMVVKSTGNVGIGTTSPSAKLHVSAGAGEAKALFTHSTSDHLSVLVGTNGAGFAVEDNNYFAIWHQDIANAGTETGITERFRVDNAGNVGIGTTSPSYKLDVNGSFNASNITATNYSVVAGKTTYKKVFSYIDTTGSAIAGLRGASNGQSAMFTFEMYGGNSGEYQKVVYSCQNAGGNWYAYKVIDQGTNNLDVVASANGTTITFTFKATSTTQSYSPTVVIEHVGAAIEPSYL